MKLKNEISGLLKKNGAFASAVFSFEKNHSKILDKDIPAFKLWLSENAHAEMSFLENNFEARANPNLILPNVKNAIIFLFPYATGHRTRNSKNKNFNKHNNLITEESIISK
ncbi:MAG: hypothetical protein K2X69_11090, partial [Silvanigrellaceae bacterium]|nr:hypothetical protein [Silvanigrellaceae bacterium]